MAEAAATISLVASIASLVDLGIKVVSRLNDFTSKAADVPESFRSLKLRLPALVNTLNAISRQVSSGRLPGGTTTALQELVQSTTTQLSVLETRLARITPPQNDTTRLKRTVKALQSLLQDDKIRAIVEALRQDIEILVLYQTSRHVDTGEQILDLLAKIQQGQHSGSLKSPTDVVPHISAHGNSHVHLGNIYHVHPNEEPTSSQVYGLCWGLAPLIDQTHFIGRLVELDQMAQVLQPGKAAIEQQRLVLGGLGGIGKTQLAIAYARQEQSSYDSTFWLNATSEMTLEASFRGIAQKLLTDTELQNLDVEGILQMVLRWFSDLRNTKWLLIFDNYDEPELFPIERYLPNTSHGSVVITTRLPDLVKGQNVRQVRVSPISDIEESLQVLKTRSNRDDVQKDPDARLLAERLAGLPLALATAGAYLRNTTLTFGQYLDAYEKRFNVNPRRPTKLQEYQDRTLYTTWDLSYGRLQQDDELAARTLQLLAYFDNQQIWYELLHGRLDTDVDAPKWLSDLVADHIDFENVMSTLVDYCLVEPNAVTQSYSMHNCVHDWTLVRLNETINENGYWYAVGCVAAGIGEVEWESLEQPRHSRYARHALRLVHQRFLQNASIDALSLQTQNLKDMELLADLLSQQAQLSAAEHLYRRVLARKKEIFGMIHYSTLRTCHNFALLCTNQGKLAEAEQLYLQALAGHEEVFGPDHISTLDTVNNLGNVYSDRGELNKAEEMYTRALVGMEKTHGLDHTSTLGIVNNLGLLHATRGDVEIAEQMHQRALAGYEKTLNPDHISIFETMNYLGQVYRLQDRLDDAEQAYSKALAGKEKVLGPDHTSTLDTVNNLGLVYGTRGNYEKATEMFTRSLGGYEKALGKEHERTLMTRGLLDYCLSKE